MKDYHILCDYSFFTRNLCRCQISMSMLAFVVCAEAKHPKQRDAIYGRVEHALMQSF